MTVSVIVLAMLAFCTCTVWSWVFWSKRYWDRYSYLYSSTTSMRNKTLERLSRTGYQNGSLFALLAFFLFVVGAVVYVLYLLHGHVAVHQTVHYCTFVACVLSGILLGYVLQSGNGFVLLVSLSMLVIGLWLTSWLVGCICCSVIVAEEIVFKAGISLCKRS